MKKIYTIIALFLLFSDLGFSQTGNLDLSFDNDGKVTTDFGTNTNDFAKAIALQTDGKIVAVGATDNDFAIARYNPNGSLDNTFGTNGKVTTPVGIAGDYANAVAIQTDGKIVVAGICFVSGNEKYGIVRYNIDGTLDNTFDLDGKVITAVGSFLNRAYALAIQADGKIIVVGDSYSNSLQYKITVVRYNANGSLDTSFDSDGISIITYGVDGGIGRSIYIQSDGKILIAGQTTNGEKFILIRCNSNGSLDSTFGNLGSTIVNFGTNQDVARSIAVQQDGKIIVAGHIGQIGNVFSYSEDFAIIRCNNDGTLDSSFDSDGKLIIDVSQSNSFDQATSVALQTDGKILIAGVSNGSNNDTAIVRLNTNGSIDNTFDTDGIAKASFASNFNDSLNSILVQNDGKIVAAGSTGFGSTDFALLRYDIVNLDTPTFILKSFSISPNPTNSILNIETKEKITSISIINILGKKTNITNFENNKIDVSNLQNGVYFIEIATESGRKVEKFIKN